MFWNSGPSKTMIAEVTQAIPVNTPDLCVLEQQQNHLVFDYGPDLTHVPKISDAFSQERLFMWQDNTREGAPPIAMKVWGDLSRQIPRARVGGGLYLVPTEDLVFIDKHRDNGLLSQRKEIQVLVPDFYNGETPKVTRAWMYYGRKEHWADKISWDQSFYRGRGGAFSVAPTYQDDRRWIGTYFKYAWRETNGFTKCFIHCHKGLSEPTS